MTTPKLRKRHNHGVPGSGTTKAKLLLALACIWPLCLIALFSASAPHVDTSRRQLGFKFRDVLDRVDVMGFGPTHPRMAVVLVGDDKNKLVTSVENIFANTDLNRIFVVVVVVENATNQQEYIEDLTKIDRGSIPHWHGLRPDVHNRKTTDDPHGKKVHVLFNDDKTLMENRNDAVEFIQILEKHHESEGLKSPEEDLLLMLIEPGAQLTSPKWLVPVTEALIVPPPILGHRDEDTVALKLANAVSLTLEEAGKRTSFDKTLTKIVSDAPAAEINDSNGYSYSSPALNGAAVVMRLHTYINLPMQDLGLDGTWPVNLDLAMNLWLCGDGIDILRDVTVNILEPTPPVPLSIPSAARFAAAWMDETTSKRFFHAYQMLYKDLTYLEWETHMSSARSSPSFTPDLTQKCRSFQWYVDNVNTDLADILEESGDIQRETQEKKEPKKSDDGGPDLSVPLHKDPLPNVTHNTEDGPDLSIAIQDNRPKPSKPLCPECLEIVKKAKPIDIAYVDVSGGHKEHPHMGARDENGNFGYVHDPTALHQNPEPFSVEEATLRAQCSKRDNNYKMLHEKVFVDFDYDKKLEGKSRPKLFCIVYTIAETHDRIPPIRQTWGSKCDGFMVASTKTDRALGAVDIVHEGPEEYDNIWQKVRSIWSYVYDNYYEEFDWFHIGGDDLFLLVENLRLYLESEEIRTAANGGIYLPDGTETQQTPLFLGRRFAYQGDMNEIFNSGGAGYTVNKAALKRLVVDGLPNSPPHMKTFSEDTVLARILKHFGIFPYETKDETGGERYMPFMPGHHYGYRMPADHSKDWYAKYSINIKEGLDHCAARSVAFHYVKGDAMTRLYALLYNKCPADTQ